MQELVASMVAVRRAAARAAAREAAAEGSATCSLCMERPQGVVLGCGHLVRDRSAVMHASTWSKLRPHASSLKSCQGAV